MTGLQRKKSKKKNALLNVENERKDPINLKSIPPPRILRESVQRHLMFIKFGRNASDSNGKSYKIISNVNLLNENNLFF